MNEKKVENIHTKPRGKGQCSPEQTCPEVPLVLYRFLILLDVYLSLWTKWQKKNINQSNQIFLPVFTCFCLFIYFPFEVGKCNTFDLLRHYTPYRKKIQPLCVYMSMYLSWGFLLLTYKHTDMLSAM